MEIQHTGCGIKWDEESSKSDVSSIRAMERRDRVADALVVLREEAEALNMYHAESMISEHGRAILEELWRVGGLGD